MKEGKMSITRRKLASRISIETDIRQDIVEQVLEGLTKVATEEIVETGDFKMSGLFTITTTEWKRGYVVGGHNVAPHKRLIIKLSTRIRQLWKQRDNEIPNTNKTINKNRPIFVNNEKDVSNTVPDNNASNNDLLDEFLNDDDDYE